MSCTVFELTGPVQSGKTTLALGMMEKLRQAKVPTIYVVPTAEDAMLLARKTPLICAPWEHVAGWAGVGNLRALVFDDVEQYPEGWEAVVEGVRQALDAVDGATQIVVVRSTA